MSLRKDIEDLVDQNIISTEQAAQIEQFYERRKANAPNRLILAFGIIGALLIGAGLILIIAHNWDYLSKTLKTIIAFTPLIICQVLCYHALTRHDQSQVWRESTAILLSLSIAACISLISQIYQISGSMSSFVLTWMLLTLPVVYVMRSSATALLYITGISYYAISTGYGATSIKDYHYWGLLLTVLPYCYHLYRTQPSSYTMSIFHWAIPLSIVCVLGSMYTGSKGPATVLVSYACLFGFLYNIGKSKLLNDSKNKSNGYLMIGALGSVVVLLILSFPSYWDSLTESKLANSNYPFREYAFILTFAIGAIAFAYRDGLSIDSLRKHPLAYVFIVPLLLFLIGKISFVGIIVANLTLLIVAVLTIRRGAKEQNLSILNAGLLMITALILCRFFDTEISFVLKGVIFVLIGLGFFYANYKLIKKEA